MSRRENRCILTVKATRPKDEGKYECTVEGDVTACQVTVEGRASPCHLVAVGYIVFVSVVVGR